MADLDVKWEPVAYVKDLDPGEVMYVEVENDPVCLINLQGEFYALGDMCTHEEASLSDGSVIGDEIECPLHGGAFAIRTGLPVSLPVVVPAETYLVRLRDGVIEAAKRSV